MNRRRKSEGYSLVELLIALAIAAIMFTGIYLVSLQSINMLQMTRDETRAIQAAQYQMEKLRSQTWMSLLTMDEKTSFTSEDNAALGLLRDGQGSILRTQITPAGLDNTPLLAVSVTVSYTGFDGDPETKTLSSAITKRGMLK